MHNLQSTQEIKDFFFKKFGRHIEDTKDAEDAIEKWRKYVEEDLLQEVYDHYDYIEDLDMSGEAKTEVMKIKNHELGSAFLFYLEKLNQQFIKNTVSLNRTYGGLSLQGKIMFSRVPKKRSIRFNKQLVAHNLKAMENDPIREILLG